MEPNSENTDGDAATVYFDASPTDDEVKDAFRRWDDLFKTYQKASPNLGAILDDEFWAAPNALSNHRYQCQAG